MASGRQPPTSHRIGYGLGVGGNVLIAWAVNIWPGWEALPFLTEATTEVLPLVNLSLLAGVLANAAYLFFDPPWFKALGGAVTVGLSFAVVLRTFGVFPFDFGADPGTWELIAEGVLIFLIVTTGLALLVQVVQFIRLLLLGPGADED